jgi:hypothetical protein
MDLALKIAWRSVAANDSKDILGLSGLRNGIIFASEGKASFDVPVFNSSTFNSSEETFTRERRRPARTSKRSNRQEGE